MQRPIGERLFAQVAAQRIGSAEDAFDGEITVGEDGMVLAMPADSDAVVLRRRM